MVVAYLRQFQKERKRHVDQETGQVFEYVEADLDDYAVAYRYAAPAIAHGLDELPKLSRDLLEKIVAMVNDRINPDVNGARLFTRRDIRRHCGVTDKFVKDYVPPLEDKEYLEIVSGGTGKGKKIIYQLAEAAENCRDEINMIKGLTTPEELAEALGLKLRSQGRGPSL